ncbi:hypothetical protein [Nonomuraea sediminis]|uniref:hypothetical protein n=1 Tax=Nonomuraea sediminis TaxID=2835864 RepID=UPI001BDC41C8|nr:hypothetical protein [Nonomuraea sediminis]
MRRWIAAGVAASAMAAALAAPAMAEAKPANPVDALKKQFVAGHGVKISEKTRTWIGREEYVGAVREGRIGFDAKGVAAVENTRTPVMTPALRKDLEKVGKTNEDTADAVDMLTERLYMIGSGNKLYVNGGLFSTLLPDDKTWVSVSGVPPYSAVAGDQLIDVFEPATLKTLLATAKRKGDQYRGTITFADLYKVSPMFRNQTLMKPKGKLSKVVVSWRITLDSNKLVKRVASSWTMPVTKKLSMSVSSETRYTDWGTDVAITAPDPSEVVDFKALTKKNYRPPTVDHNIVIVPPDDEGKVDQ